MYITMYIYLVYIHMYTVTLYMYIIMYVVHYNVCGTWYIDHIVVYYTLAVCVLIYQRGGSRQPLGRRLFSRHSKN